MMHVDALSRKICYIETMPIERELEFRQLQDSQIKEIANHLEFADSERFELVDGLVYRRGDDRSRFFVPEGMVNNLIKTHHDEMAHCGVEKTYQGLFRSYWFPSMRKRIRDYIDGCVVCLMTNLSENRHESEMQEQETPRLPFQIVHTDHFGPLQESDGGYKFILLVIDAFTRFTWLFPTRSTGSKETIDNLRFLFGIFGSPEGLVSDRGTAFTSREFADFLNDLRVKHRQVAVASPWANGLAERVNRVFEEFARSRK